MESNLSIPICPMLSSGTGYDVICAQEKCAWYIKNSRLCSIYVIAHNNMLDIQQKQALKKNN